MESREKVVILISLTRIKSEPVIDAIVDHLVKGFSKKDSAILNDVVQQDFNRNMVKLNEIAGKVERIKELDWSKPKST